MTTIATLGPEGSPAWQAARLYDPDAEIKLYTLIPTLTRAFLDGQTDLAVIPVYNTREGEIKEYFRAMETLPKGYWIDNVLLPIQLSFGSLTKEGPLTMIEGKASALRQCEEYIANHFPDVDLKSVRNLEQTYEEIVSKKYEHYGIIDDEESLKKHGLTIRERDVAPHNQTRFAVLGKQPAVKTGYDATAVLTAPLKDRVGLLYDILGEFTRRGVSLLDMRTENDIKTQKLRIYFEAEGHIDNPTFSQALQIIEEKIIQEPGSIKVLGSFPRVDMRTKRINSFGFIGTGAMSGWFADRLTSEGYQALLTGRSTKLTPEEMIPQVDVVVICVPISATAPAVEKYGPLLKDGQALILLAGEAENTLNTALQKTANGVEVMLVHNLWGPQAATMKDKNAAVVRTVRSGILCSEFEAFLYKHGALINQDTPDKHDLLMGVGQKLPTTISVAMAMTLAEHSISNDDISSHSTLTSLYGILAMARIHTQNPRTYAEIMATKGDGRKIVESFVRNLQTSIEMSESGDIEKICAIIEKNRHYLTDEFLEACMKRALSVDDILGKMKLSY
jgi:prephenate dehydratase/prephenate dehydrogenase